MAKTFFPTFWDTFNRNQSSWMPAQPVSGSDQAFHLAEKLSDAVTNCLLHNTFAVFFLHSYGLKFTYFYNSLIHTNPLYWNWSCRLSQLDFSKSWLDICLITILPFFRVTFFLCLTKRSLHFYTSSDLCRESLHIVMESDECEPIHHPSTNVIRVLQKQPKPVSGKNINSRLTCLVWTTQLELNQFVCVKPSIVKPTVGT